MYDWPQPKATSQELLSSNLALPLTFCVAFRESLDFFASPFKCVHSPYRKALVSFVQAFPKHKTWTDLESHFYCVLNTYALPVSWYLVVFNCSNCQHALITYIHTLTHIRHTQIQKNVVSWKIDHYFRAS